MVYDVCDLLTELLCLTDHCLLANARSLCFIHVMDARHSGRVLTDEIILLKNRQNRNGQQNFIFILYTTFWSWTLKKDNKNNIPFVLLFAKHSNRVLHMRQYLSKVSFLSNKILLTLPLFSNWYISKVYLRPSFSTKAGGVVSNNWMRGSLSVRVWLHSHDFGTIR